VPHRPQNTGYQRTCGSASFSHALKNPAMESRGTSALVLGAALGLEG